MSSTPSSRKDYIDLTKGIGMTMVVLVHTFQGHLLFLYLGLVPIFFFISGYLFSPTQSFASFFKKRVNGIVVPFLFFFVFSFLLQLLISKISHNYSNLQFNHIFNEHISINGPLWFLVCLFVVSLLYYGVMQISNHRVESVVVIACSLLGFYLNESVIDLPFYIDSALSAMLYFHLGRLARGLSSIQAISRKGSALYFVIALFFTIAIGRYQLTTDLRDNVLGHNYLIFAFSTMGAVFSIYFFSRWVSFLPILNWAGKNSLILLCLQEPIYRVVFYFLGYNIKGGVIAFVAVFVGCYFSAFVLNRYFSKLVGAAPMFSLKKGSF